MIRVETSDRSSHDWEARIASRSQGCQPELIKNLAVDAKVGAESLPTIDADYEPGRSAYPVGASGAEGDSLRSPFADRDAPVRPLEVVRS